MIALTCTLCYAQCTQQCCTSSWVNLNFFAATEQIQPSELLLQEYYVIYFKTIRQRKGQQTGIKILKDGLHISNPD